MTRPIYRVKAEFFKTLGHPARIRVLEVLRDGERPVNELIPEVGIEPSHLSQQLAILRRANLVRSRKVGSSVLYSVSEPRVFERRVSPFCRPAGHNGELTREGVGSHPEETFHDCTRRNAATVGEVAL